MTNLRLIENFSIKTVDMRSAKWAQMVSYSFKQTGFAIITNHNISKDTIQAAYAQWIDFFASKDKFRYMSKNGNQGYSPFKSENAKGNSIKDLKEFYHLFSPFDNVPNGISITTVQNLSSKLIEIARQILYSLQSEIPRELVQTQGETLHRMIKNSPNNLLRILHYPKLPEDIEPGAVRAAAHEDINLITLLIAATQPGLQVKDLEGKWHDVECEPGSIVVNVGDMLQEASGGLFKSTTHRVVNPIGDNVSRYSMPMFIHPRPECILSSRYTAGQYLNERLREIGLVK